MKAAVIRLTEGQQQDPTSNSRLRINLSGPASPRPPAQPDREVENKLNRTRSGTRQTEGHLWDGVSGVLNSNLRELQILVRQQPSWA